MTSLDKETAVTRDYFITVWMSEGLVWMAETAFIWNFLQNHHLPCPSFSLRICTWMPFNSLLSLCPLFIKNSRTSGSQIPPPRTTLLFIYSAWAEQKCTHRRLRLCLVCSMLWWLFRFFFSFPQITKHQDLCGGCIPGTFGDWLLLGLLIVCCGKK